MLTIVPTCDICGKAKGITNNWFVAVHKVGTKDLGQSRFAIFDWTMKRAQAKNAKHICGEGCLATFISRDLANRTARPKPTADSLVRLTNGSAESTDIINRENSDRIVRGAFGIELASFGRVNAFTCPVPMCEKEG